MLLSDEGKVLALTFWENEEAAEAGIAGTRSFYAEQVNKFVTLYRSPPGREMYDVVRRRRAGHHDRLKGGAAMTRLFGIPMGSLEVVLVAMLFVALAMVGVAGAARNRVFFRLGVRNVRRRPGRSALIVVGLMLGTAIIAAALATGDTMTRTVRSSAVSALGQTDELVAAKGATPDLAVQSGSATGVRYFPLGRLRADPRGSCRRRRWSTALLPRSSSRSRPRT